MEGLKIKHFLLATQIRTEQTVPRFTLFGVDQWILIQADKEYPTTVASLDVFARFHVVVAGDYRFRIRVQCESEAVPSRTRSTYKFKRMLTEPNSLADTTFRLAYVRLPRSGRYRIILQAWGKEYPWQESQWHRIATETFFVEKRT
jgi:hypothetical protein